MALINCPECSKQISSKAEACPGCGYVVSKIPLVKNQGETYSTESLRNLPWAVRLLIVAAATIFVYYALTFVFAIVAKIFPSTATFLNSPIF